MAQARRLRLGGLSTQSPSYNDYTDEEKSEILRNLSAQGPGDGDKGKKKSAEDVLLTKSGNAPPQGLRIFMDQQAKKSGMRIH